jgi:hypothetical protein
MWCKKIAERNDLLLFLQIVIVKVTNLSLSQEKRSDGVEK